MTTPMSRLSPEQLRYVCGLRLDGMTLRNIASQVEEESGISYSYRQYSNFFRSIPGRELLEDIHKELVEHWRKQPLAEKYSRVDGLVIEAQRLRDVLTNSFDDDLKITEEVLETVTTPTGAGKTKKEIKKSRIRVTYEILGVGSPEYERVLNQYLKVMVAIREELEPKRLEIKDAGLLMSPFEKAAAQLEAIADTAPSILQKAFDESDIPVKLH